MTIMCYQVIQQLSLLWTCHNKGPYNITASGELVPEDCVSPHGQGRILHTHWMSGKSQSGWTGDVHKSMPRACLRKSLGQQRILVASSLASSDTLIPSTRKDADDTQELKLKIYEVASLQSRRPHRWHKLAKLSLVLTFS